MEPVNSSRPDELEAENLRRLICLCRLSRIAREASRPAEASARLETALRYIAMSYPESTSDAAAPITGVRGRQRFLTLTLRQGWRMGQAPTQMHRRRASHDS